MLSTLPPRETALAQDPSPVVNGLISAWLITLILWCLHQIGVKPTRIHGEFWHCQFLQ